MRSLGRRPRGEKGAALFFSQYVRKDDVVIEVGANRGGSTLTLADCASHVYALEPAAPTFRYLRVFAAEKKNVTACNVGAGRTNEDIEYFVGRTPYASSRFRVANQAYLGRSTMRVVRLDSLEFPLRPTCLVMDCEGSEVDALIGAAGLFNSNCIRTTLVETHRLSDGTATLNNVLMLLEGHGFECKVKEDGERLPWVLSTRSRPAPRQQD